MRTRDRVFRPSIAIAARQVLSRELGLFDFIKQAGGYDTGDEQVDELIDLLEHEPAAGGWLGVGQQTHSEYVAEINRVIALLDA
jgi:hypothetical protein